MSPPLRLGPEIRTLDAILASRAASTPDELAFADHQENLSYGQLRADSEAIAGGLASTTSPKFVPGFRRLRRFGFRVVPANARRDPSPPFGRERGEVFPRLSQDLQDRLAQTLP